MNGQLTFEEYSDYVRLRSMRMCRHCRYFVVDRFGRFFCFRENKRMEISSKVNCGSFRRRENWFMMDKHFKT